MFKNFSNMFGGDIAVDLGKAGHKKDSVEFQRFYKKHCNKVCNN